MIEIIKQLLREHENDVHISKNDDFIMIYEGVYPEDCIKIITGKQKYLVLDVCRDKEHVLRETENKNEAAVYAAVLYKSFYDIRLYMKIDRRNYGIIRNYVKAGEENKALKFTTDKFPDSVFSIDYEDKSKISLIRDGDKAHVKYGGKYIVKDRNLAASYGVLNTYTGELYYINEFYENRIKPIDCAISHEDICRLYILKE
ncbi:MAG: hypothetical protein J1E62_04580 [Lachnospiraceae bacterium]|nr:hypothetical protein [Lachnospiraceae bacterium]